ncbi:MAG: hypothetical protein HY550_11635 [Elusimicrobia bacterium]|nr:hypothetical protein [Elusimicrobiota bacterium]
MTIRSRIITAVSVLVFCGVFVAPFVHYFITGKFPRGFPVQASSSPRPGPVKSGQGPAPAPAVMAGRTAAPPVPARSVRKFFGFTPYYYEEKYRPDIGKLRDWGANTVNIMVEDLAGALDQNRLLGLGEEGVDGQADCFPPPDVKTEKEVRELAEGAHALGLVVNLVLPVSPKWLKLAEELKAQMILINWEGDARYPEAGDSADALNRTNAVLLKEAKKHYSGLIGVGFTNLIRRDPAGGFAENPHAGGLDARGYDFLTINPHPDPSMTPDGLIEYAAASAEAARKIAAKSGIEKVLLAAVMVKAESSPVRGFVGSGHEYSAEEEARFYGQLFSRTSGLLDGYFLDFSGWEKRPAAAAISAFYGKAP